MRHTLGSADEVHEGKSKAYTLTINNKTVALFVVHFRGTFYGYENQCPHTGVNLNWQPDQFIDHSGKNIICTTHGALFRIEDGLCEWGPCLGQQLRSLTIHIENGKLILTDSSSTFG